MNKVEKVWVLAQLMAHGAPLQKMKTLDGTCAKVAADVRTRQVLKKKFYDVRTRQVLDVELVSDQNDCGMTWRRSYMLRVTSENVRQVANSVDDMVKKAVVETTNGEEDGPVAAFRGRENDAQHILDQMVLDYLHEAAKRTLTTGDDAVRAITRNRESRSDKNKRKKERKEIFEANKRQRNQQRETCERRKSAAEVQNLRAQTRIANAATAGAALQRRQSEQFGILVNLYAQSHNLASQQLVTPLPPALPTEPLLMDPELVQGGRNDVLELAGSDDTGLGVGTGAAGNSEEDKDA